MDIVIYNIYHERYFCFYSRWSCSLYVLHDVCFYFTRKKFYCGYSYTSVKVLESPGIASKVLQKFWNFEAKSPGKGPAHWYGQNFLDNYLFIRPENLKT